MDSYGQPSVLILTAGFGEGHNSAARSLKAALEERTRVIVDDPCALGQPRLNRFAKWAYIFMITRTPLLWKWFFKLSDKMDMSKDPLIMLNGIRKALEYEVTHLNPDVIISTYPLYPYFLDRLYRKNGKRIPYFVVVTDSLIINKSWLCVDPDAWLVTDSETAERMNARGIPEDKIIVTGFPVSLAIENQTPLGETGWEPGLKVRILYFANKSRKETEEDLNALALSLQDSSITIVLGKNVRRLYRVAERVKRSYPEKIKIIGWTRKVPELLASHHLAIGKAGGATIHEVMASQCPFLVNQIVFGQEQGNAELLEHAGGGWQAIGPEALIRSIRKIFCGETPCWPEMKRSLINANMRGGTRKIVDLVLQKAEKNSN